jgi:hypothetical protein
MENYLNVSKMKNEHDHWICQEKNLPKFESHLCYCVLPHARFLMFVNPGDLRDMINMYLPPGEQQAAHAAVATGNGDYAR